MDMELLEDIVRTDAKGRYSFNEDRTLIRANQGHSIPVDVELTETAPPQVLYHGTASRFEQAILEQGLKPMSRLYVHLSGDAKTALTVGRRHGKPVVFEVDSGRMSRDGEHVYIAQNGVWLTKRVKPEYLKQMCIRDSIRVMGPAHIIVQYLCFHVNRACICIAHIGKG